MSSMADRMLKRIRAKGRGWVFTPKHFLDFGSRGAVDIALSRLAQSNAIRRTGRGIYDYPRLHDRLGALSPDPAVLAERLRCRQATGWHPRERLPPTSSGYRRKCRRGRAMLPAAARALAGRRGAT